MESSEATAEALGNDLRGVGGILVDMGDLYFSRPFYNLLPILHNLKGYFKMSSVSPMQIYFFFPDKQGVAMVIF